MKILHVYKDYRPVIGGIENHIRLLARAQAAAGHSVTVLACAEGWRGETYDEDGVRVLKVARLATAASMPLSLALPLWLRAQHPEITHLHAPFPLGELANWIWPRGQATVITYHSDIVRQQRLLRLYAPFLRRILAHAQAIIATSPAYAASSPWLAPVQHKCRIVPLGVETTRFAPSPTPPEPWPGPGIQTRPFRVLFVGRLRYYKDLPTLLQALVSLPNTHLTIVGDGPLRKTWQNLALSLSLGPRTLFAGEVPEERLLAHYRQADLFVLPANSRAEAFGTVLLEAMACGLPAVSTELGTGTSWVNQDGQTGRVVPPGNPAALAQALAHLQEHPDELRRMGRNARTRVVDSFTLPRMVAGVEAVYRSVLPSPASPPPPVPGPHPGARP